MCRPIRALTQMKGFDITTHVLACFGGAGGQHACAIARSLGMKTIFVHRFSGILSAYGIGLADVVKERQAPCAVALTPTAFPQLAARLRELAVTVTGELTAKASTAAVIEVHLYLHLR